MAPARVRLFVGVFPPPAAVASLTEHIPEILAPLAPAKVRPVPVENLHLTLCFIGSIAETEIEPIAAALRSTHCNFALGRISLIGLGVFPSLRRARVLWAGVEGDLASLSCAARSVRDAVSPWIEKPDPNPFHPHLTLARFPDGTVVPSDLLKRFEKRNWGNFECVGYRLVRSRQGPPGSPYELVEEYL